MAQFVARVLFTKHVQKKRKTWQDGFLAVNSQNVNNRSGKLYDAEGKPVASSRIPASQIIDAESEGHFWASEVATKPLIGYTRVT